MADAEGWRASPRSVDPADEPADVARGQAGLEVNLEEAGAAVGAAEEAARRVYGVRSATHASHGGRSSGDGRRCGSGHHDDSCLCFLARRLRGMSDRLRGRVSFGGCCRTLNGVDLESARGPGAWFGRSNRVVASDWLLRQYGRRPAVRQSVISDPCAEGRNAAERRAPSRRPRRPDR